MPRSRITDVALADISLLPSSSTALSSLSEHCEGSAMIRRVMTTTSFTACFRERHGRLQMARIMRVSLINFLQSALTALSHRRRGLGNFFKGEHEKHIKGATADPVKYAVHLKNLGAVTLTDFPFLFSFFLLFPVIAYMQLNAPACGRKFARAAVLTRTESSAVMRFRLNNSVVISLMRFAT